MPPDCWQTDNSNGLVMVIRNYNWLNLASRVLILLHWRLQHFLSLGCYHISFFFFIPFIPYSSHFQLLTSQCASLAPLVQAVNTHCLILTYNPRLAKVKVDPHAKNQGQRVQTGERPQTNGWTHTHGRYQTYYLPCYTVDKNTTDKLQSNALKYKKIFP